MPIALTSRSITGPPPVYKAPRSPAAPPAAAAKRQFGDERRIDPMGLSLLARRDPLASATEQVRLLAQTTACPPFETALDQAGLFPLEATGITTLQLNVGKLCNQTCRHCHVDAGPDRTEV